VYLLRYQTTISNSRAITSYSRFTVSNVFLIYFVSLLNLSAVTESVSRVIPSLVRLSGGNVVSVLGSNFQDSSFSTCKFELVSSQTELSQYTPKITSTIVPALFVSATTILCTTPVFYGDTYSLKVASNGVHFLSSPIILKSFVPATISSITPTVASSAGGDIITIQLAQALVADSSGSVDLRGTCIFGGSQSAITVATLQGLSAFLCAVPPEPGIFIESQNFLRIEVRTASFSASISTAFWFVGTPTITSVNPTVGTEVGATRMFLQGFGFNPAQFYSCSMNRVVLKVAALTSTTLSLISTPNPRGSYPVTCVNSLKNVFHSFVFVVYDQVSISSIQPLFGPPGTRVLITLSNPFESNSMICRFDQYIDQPATSWNATTIACFIPALSKISVTIEASLDGISYAIANAVFQVLTIGSILNKLSPSTSPISGGIPVMVYGDDFHSASSEKMTCSFRGFQGRAGQEIVIILGKMLNTCNERSLLS